MKAQTTLTHEKEQMEFIPQNKFTIVYSRI